MQPKRFVTCTNPLLLLVLAFVFTLCSKGDYTGHETLKSNKAQAYFTVAASAEPLIHIVAAKMQQRNQQAAYVTRLSEQAGIPQWNKVMRVSDPKAGMLEMEGNKHEKQILYIIPFVKEGARRVSAMLVVKLKGADTAYRMI